VTVLDASAALAFLQGELGSDVVREHLSGAVMGAANLAEVLSKMGGSIESSLAEAVLAANGVRIEPVTVNDARIAAQLHDTSSSLSLGDRLCLALADRMDEAVLTADRAWGSGDRIVQIR
jgi:Uncharacterized protein conserved in bacteria